MKKSLLFLVLAALLTASVPALAADYTADSIAFMGAKAVFEDPATEKQMRSIMPDAMTKMNAITSGTTGAVTYPVLAATTSAAGATLVGVYDTATYFTGTTVEAVLAELGLSRANLALTTTPGGASYIGVFDTATHFTGTNVESVLAEIGVSLADTMTLIDTPVEGSVATVTALGGVTNGGTLLADLATFAQVAQGLLALGIYHEPVNRALAGGIIPATPADGYRVFCTADGGAFTEGKIYEYDDVDGWDAGVNVTAGQLVLTYDSNLIVGGTSLTDWTQIDDYALAADLSTRHAAIVDIASDTTPADPGIEGYRVFMTSDDGSLAEGKIYTWDDTGNAWDAGVTLADGQLVTVKGVNPDIIVGGTGLTNYEQLSDKMAKDQIACKDITVAMGSATPAATAADPDWVDAYYLSASPVSGADQVVASVVIAGDGAVTLVLAAVSTAEAVYRVCAILD